MTVPSLKIKLCNTDTHTPSLGPTHVEQSLITVTKTKILPIQDEQLRPLIRLTLSIQNSSFSLSLVPKFSTGPPSLSVSSSCLFFYEKERKLFVFFFFFSSRPLFPDSK